MNAESADSSDQQIVWRTDPSMRIIGPMACVILCAVTVYVPFTRQGTPVLVGLLCAIFVVFVIGTWLMAYRPYLRLGTEFLEFRNSSQVYRLKYNEIAKVTVGYFGLRLWLSNGEFLTAKVIQKSNYAKIVSERTRGDKLVADIYNRIDLSHRNM